MELHLNEKLESIFILKQLDTILKELTTSSEFEDILANLEDIDLVKTIVDPVQDFIDYWNSESNALIDINRQQYIKNALYAVKGAPEVFETFERYFEIELEYEYNYPIVKVVNITTTTISDVNLFVNKFKTLLFHLLYYTELNLYIKNLILKLKGDLKNSTVIATKGYSTNIIQWNGDIF